MKTTTFVGGGGARANIVYYAPYYVWAKGKIHKQVKRL